MFRGLNDVLQEWIQQQILAPPPTPQLPFLMTLWFNPSLFTIPRKMLQSPLDLWSDTSNLCLALACLSFVFYCTQAHPTFRAIRLYHICFIYSMSHKSGLDNLFWFPIRKSFHANIWTLALPFVLFPWFNISLFWIENSWSTDTWSYFFLSWCWSLLAHQEKKSLNITYFFPLFSKNTCEMTVKSCTDVSC